MGSRGDPRSYGKEARKDLNWLEGFRIENDDLAIR